MSNNFEILKGLDMVATGQMISQLIKKSGLSTREISEQMNLSVQAVSKWRNGYSLPELENLFILSRILGVRVDDFLVPRK